MIRASPDAQSNLSLYTVTALLILDSDGNRVLAKYYAPPHQTAPGTGLVADLGAGPGGPGMGGLSNLKEQKTFEKSVWEKVRRGGGECWRDAPSPPSTSGAHRSRPRTTCPGHLQGFTIWEWGLTRRGDPPAATTRHPHQNLH